MTQKLQQLQQAIREVCTELRVVMNANRRDATAADLPIQLQHILRAIGEDVSIDSGGYLWFYDERKDIWELSLQGEKYNLTLPLDQQAPEVIDFLHSIICKG